MVEILKVDARTAGFKDIKPAVQVLLQGGIVAGPTQTFYGLMACADKDDALARIMTLKGRDGKKPLLLLLDKQERAICYARELPETAYGLVKKFWPGPLTLLLRALPGIPAPLLGPAQTVGVRVEGLPVIRLLVRALDRAVTGTSANPGGDPPAQTAEEVEAYFHNNIDMIIDTGPCPGGFPSTLVDVSLGRPRLIRYGALSLDEMMAVAPDMRT